mmetsp:Transcript_20414/g.53105  ORF Transcript_20414/g.53105 Transcript_20414/m.53105 type:complete len:237 (-) Transcript_20414:1188-1898(-)
MSPGRANDPTESVSKVVTDIASSESAPSADKLSGEPGADVGNATPLPSTLRVRHAASGRTLAAVRISLHFSKSSDDLKSLKHAVVTCQSTCLRAALNSEASMRRSGACMTAAKSEYTSSGNAILCLTFGAKNFAKIARAFDPTEEETSSVHSAISLALNLCSRRSSPTAFKKSRKITRPSFVRYSLNTSRASSKDMTSSHVKVAAASSAASALSASRCANNFLQSPRRASRSLISR